MEQYTGCVKILRVQVIKDVVYINKIKIPINLGMSRDTWYPVQMAAFLILQAVQTQVKYQKGLVLSNSK